ncbi:MAG: hypothetical protein VKL39_10080 [Leptolyngbyaceae bacterium]|nr:hypothetical protein [Leptolyngbyaceae bacterium]
MQRIIVKRWVLVGGAIALTLLPACRQQPPVSEEPPTLPVEPPPLPSSANDSDRQPLPDDVQIYRDESDLFALAFPAGYTYESIDNGITFLSEDEGFGGIIQYQDTEVENIAPESLNEVLRATIEAQFSDVSWQSDLQEQADGSFRLDWNAVNPAGQPLDALSFIEQHGETLFILTAYGIDRDYSDYNDDARIIVGTYVVQENPPESDETASEEEPADGAS